MTNEAAERLRTDARDTIRMVRPEGWAVDWWMATVDRALAAERKATVERAEARRQRIYSPTWFAILDAEGAR
jgi:hypothetical protein